MMQSIGTLSDEITALRKAITGLPENIERKLQTVKLHSEQKITEKVYLQR